MSLDAGGLAQMTYNQSFNGSALGVPSSGFASRGKGSHIKRLSVPTQTIGTVGESQPTVTVSAPRTSRSHLLAGLRTAPKSATVPSVSAAQHQQQHLLNLHCGGRYAQQVPQTATGAGFPSQQAYATTRPLYTLPEQVLAPPMIDLVGGGGGGGGGDTAIDEKLYAELMSTNLFLAAQQQRLQQQLISVTAAAQQFQNLHLGMHQQHHHQQQQQQQQMHGMAMPNMGFYQQQLQQGVQPVVQPVPGQPGVFSVYNPLTGQQSFVVDHSAQQDRSPPPAYQEKDESPVRQSVPAFRAELSPPRESVMSPAYSRDARGGGASPAQDVSPLPPPSANAFRRGHRKSASFMPTLNTNLDAGGARTSGSAVGSGPKSAMFPPTPLTGTFGPGQGRAGEHPLRQPRGPPSLEDLVAKPTSKHEGSKNFATRQRRRAVHSLVRAGIERRGESRSGGYHSSSSGGGTNTPASEKEFTFVDGDDTGTSTRSSLSSKPSLGSLRAAANGAIGSERKERSRTSPDSPYASSTPTSEDGGFFGAKFAGRTSPPVTAPSVAAIVAGQRTVTQAPERRKMPMLVLSSAEKRKTPIA